MNVFTGPNDLLHGDEHLEELEDWELRERFFNALRDLTEAADTVETVSYTHLTLPTTPYV